MIVDETLQEIMTGLNLCVAQVRRIAIFDEHTVNDDVDYDGNGDDDFPFVRSVLKLSVQGTLMAYWDKYTHTYTSARARDKHTHNWYTYTSSIRTGRVASLEKTMIHYINKHPVQHKAPHANIM